MSELGLSPQLTNDFVDVFAWQIDFFRLQEGDRFKLVYEDHLVEGKSIGTGKIKSILFEHYGNDFYAFHYDQGDGIDYFDENGNMEYQWYNGTVSVENRIKPATAQNYSLQKSQYAHVSIKKAVASLKF